MPAWSEILFYTSCFLLLFVFIPIKFQNKTSVEKQFIEYIQFYNKSYNNETIFQQRLQSFKKSLESIEKLNKAKRNNTSALYGLTKYSDLSMDEFVDNLLQLDMEERISGRYADSEEDNSAEKRSKRSLLKLPLKIDWRKQGAVTAVNNQQLCGACWAFSTIENVESMYAIKTGNLVQFSIQQMIDCAGYKNSGCNGGDMCNLLRWLKDEQVNISKNNEYPLHLRNEKCKLDQTREGVRISDFACQNLVNDEDYLLATLAKHGPVAVAINALTWQNYLSGVIQFHCDGSVKFLNHAVQIVGYDLSADIPHYIVRNSWGTDFGDEGYLYVAIGDNVCGIANEVTGLNIV